MGRKFRAALIGCGRIGSEFDDDPKRKIISSHAGAHSKNPDIEFVAASDLDSAKLEKCKKRWNVPRTYSDYKEMLAKEKPDIVSVCTPSFTHCQVALDAAAAGVRAVFCEKPISDSLADAERMVDGCRRAGIPLFVDHGRRFDAFHRAMRDMVLAGKLGRIQQAHFHYTAGIANTGSHMLDLLRFFLGDAEWVSGSYSENKSPNEKDPNIDGMIRFKSGATASIAACDVKEYLMFELELVGTKGRLRITHSGFGAELEEVKDSKLFSGYKELEPVPLPDGVPRPEGRFLEGAVAHIVDVLGGRDANISSGEDGIASLELISALMESADRNGERVMLPLVKRDRKIHSR